MCQPNKADFVELNWVARASTLVGPADQWAANLG